MKTKIKSPGDEVTGFPNKKAPKRDSNHTCLAVISMDSAFKKDQNYYLEDISEECQYIEKKVVRHIIDDLKGFSDDSNYSDGSDEEHIKDMK